LSIYIRAFEFGNSGILASMSSLSFVTEASGCGEYMFTWYSVGIGEPAITVICCLHKTFSSGSFKSSTFI
jgi:hypothetical protein